MTTLLDGSVLIALAVSDHEHAPRARLWFTGLDDSFATCPFTQGSLVRFLVRRRSDVRAAKAVLASFTDLPHHVFWPDSIGYGDVPMAGVVGHRQVTDAYLAQMARANGGRLATLDKGLAALHRDLAELID